MTDFSSVLPCSYRSVNMWLSLVVAVSLISNALSASIQGKMVLSEKLNIPQDFSRTLIFNDARVVAVRNGAEIARTVVTGSGSFSLSDISDTGFFTLYFAHPMLVFEPVTVEVASSGQISAFTYDALAPSRKSPLPYPLTVIPVHFQMPYVPEEEFNAFQFLKSPMVIMGLVMVGLVWLLPKLQNGVSPEEMQEMRKDLENDDGITASFLKKMIPVSADGGAAGSLSIPSLGGEDKKRK